MMYEDILASLHLPETQDRFDQVETAFEKTCEWIFDEKLAFTQWLQCGSGMF
jgi:hypothetical protein